MRIAYESGWLLGHKVVQIMVDKAAGRHQKMPDNWLRVILSIAGDPRVSTRAFNYVRWWARLGNEICQAGPSVALKDGYRAVSRSP